MRGPLSLNNVVRLQLREFTINTSQLCSFTSKTYGWRELVVDCITVSCQSSYSFTVRKVQRIMICQIYTLSLPCAMMTVHCKKEGVRSKMENLYHCSNLQFTKHRCGLSPLTQFMNQYCPFYVLETFSIIKDDQHSR